MTLPAAWEALREGEWAELPRELQLEVTSRCNLRCSACLRTHQELWPDADLTLADFERITAPLAGLERIAFQLNGEPLLCSDLFAMVRHAVARGVHTVVNSNGILLDERRRAEVLASGLHELRISLDGARRDTVRRAVGADVQGRVVESTRALLQERGARSTPRVSLWMIARRETLAELPDVVRLGAELGCDEVYLQRLVITGHGAATRASSLYGRLEPRHREILARAEELAGRLGIALTASGLRAPAESLDPPAAPRPWRGCSRPWRSATVTASMLVLPCCISSFVIPYAELALGVLEGDWQAVWNGARYRTLRRRLLADDPPEPCRGCGVDWSL